jgi:hypothetical protein
MQSEKLNHWLSILGNIGVIVGIIFLAIEISQNTDMMRSQTRDSITGKNLELLMSIGADEYASDVFSRGMNGDLLDGPGASGESLSFFYMFQGTVRIWENEWYQYQQGLFGDQEFAARQRSWGRAMNTPGAKVMWERIKAMYSEEFQNVLDDTIG